MATATATMEASSTLIQTESRVQHSYHQEMHQEMHMTSGEQHIEKREKVKKKKSLRRHKDEGTVSVSKSSEKLHKKLKASADVESNPKCEKCSRPVYAMERVKAEKRIWHKECFRCVQCNKQLTVETYQSDHTTLYCKPHFKQLFEPKPVDGGDEPDAAPSQRHKLIIAENNPVELPPDVVRASEKPDLGIEELTQLDLKSRFEVFERGPQQSEPEPLLQPKASREKSQALLSKLAKFKAKGMDVGVSDEYLNGVPVEVSSSEQEDEDDDEILKKSYKHTANKEQPMSFCNMSEIVGKFEKGEEGASERHRERKQEIQNIRSRLFMGKQQKIKEMYEESVKQSEQSKTSADKIARDLELDAEKARLIKQRFENGEVFNDENQPPKSREIEDSSLFDEEKAQIIMQRFENGHVFNAKNQPTKSHDNDGSLYIDEEKARLIKERFENGEVFGDDKQHPKYLAADYSSLFDEERARLIKEKFETGEVFIDKHQANKNHDIEDSSLFNEGISKKSRSIFLELDANAKNMGPLSPPPQDPPKRKEIPFVPKDVVRAEDKVEDVQIQTADISDRFKFFETYKPQETKRQFRMTPPRQAQRPKSPSPEVYVDPSVVRCNQPAGAVDTEFAADRHTASRMINVFRQMELTQGHNDQHGPKPLKRFTPPPPGESNHHGHSSSEEEYSSEEEEEDSEEERRREAYEARQRDEALRQAQQLARTTSFRSRFENWSESEQQQQQQQQSQRTSNVLLERGTQGGSYEDDDGESQLETAKSLREKFENMKVQQSSTVNKSFVTKVNRFV